MEQAGLLEEPLAEVEAELGPIAVELRVVAAVGNQGSQREVGSHPVGRVAAVKVEPGMAEGFAEGSSAAERSRLRHQTWQQVPEVVVAPWQEARVFERSVAVQEELRCEERRGCCLHLVVAEERAAGVGAGQARVPDVGCRRHVISRARLVSELDLDHTNAAADSQ